MLAVVALPAAAVFEVLAADAELAAFVSDVLAAAALDAAAVFEESAEASEASAAVALACDC